MKWAEPYKKRETCKAVKLSEEKNNCNLLNVKLKINIMLCHWRMRVFGVMNLFF